MEAAVIVGLFVGVCSGVGLVWLSIAAAAALQRVVGADLAAFMVGLTLFADRKSVV